MSLHRRDLLRGLVVLPVAAIIPPVASEPSPVRYVPVKLPGRGGNVFYWNGRKYVPIQPVDGRWEQRP